MSLYDQMKQYLPNGVYTNTCPDAYIYVENSLEIDYGYNFRETSRGITCSYDPAGQIPICKAKIIAIAPTFEQLITKLKLLNWPKEKIE